jgi:hypothetical protein
VAPPNLAAQLIELLASLEVGSGADVAAARALARLDPVEAVHVLKVLVERGKESARAGKVLFLATRALAFGPDDVFSPEQRGRIYAAAAEFSVPQVAALFVKDAPSLEVDPGLIDQPDPVIGHLTLGHKKMLARKVDGDRIARFAMEPDPSVIRELLLNPRLTEDMVVRIAARRPARVPVLNETWRSTRWSLRRGVRAALAMNPYTPPEVALKLLPQLQRADLVAIAGDGSLHAGVRELAAKLAYKPGAAPASGAGRPLEGAAEQVAQGGEPAGQDDQRKGQDQDGDLAGGELEAGHRKS